MGWALSYVSMIKMKIRDLLFYEISLILDDSDHPDRSAFESALVRFFEFHKHNAGKEIELIFPEHGRQLEAGIRKLMHQKIVIENDIRFINLALKYEKKKKFPPFNISRADFFSDIRFFIDRHYSE